jgi:chromosome partitioning protein
MCAGKLAGLKACKLADILILIESMIIVIANSKGGVGKSTIAAHLAGHLFEQGYSVTLADCDAQGSSSVWIAEAAPGVKTVRLTSPDKILKNLPLLGGEADFVIADGPGSDAETSRALLLRADLAIIPCKASMLEVRALQQATEVLRQAQDIRGGAPDATIALSMVGKNYRLTRDMKDAAAMLDLPVAKTAIVLRQIYADAPGQGALVWGLGAKGREAGEEIRSLFRELLPQRKTRGKKPTRKRRAKAKRSG